MKSGFVMNVVFIWFLIKICLILVCPVRLGVLSVLVCPKRRVWCVGCVCGVCGTSR